MVSEDHTAQTSQAVTAVEWMCPNCGAEVDNGEECEAWDCVYCGETMVPRDKSDVTPNDTLRELIEGWRNEINDLPRGYAGGVQRCADDLEELVEDG